MLITIPPWRVQVDMPDGKSHIFWISDQHLSNVVRKVADIRFDESGLIQPTKITFG